MSYQLIRHTTDPASIAAYSRFLSQPYIATGNHIRTERTTPEYLEWQYAANPSGQALGYSALYGEEVVGHFSSLPVIGSLYGEKVKGLLALNLVTHPDHRGKGLFIKMAEKTFDDAQTEGYRFVIGVANQNSTHGLVNRLGFSLVSPLQVMVGLGSLKVDTSRDYAFRTLWKPDTLNWRLASPSSNYYHDRTGHIITATGKFGIYAQMKQLEIEERQRLSLEVKSRFLRLWIGLAGGVEKNIRHFVLPDRLKPAPLNFIFRSLTDYSVTLKKDDIFFELIDFDIY